MEAEKKVLILQMVYTAALADSVFRLGKEGVLGKVTAQKRQEQMLTGKVRAQQFGVTKPEDVFSNFRKSLIVLDGRLNPKPLDLLLKLLSANFVQLPKRWVRHNHAIFTVWIPWKEWPRA